VTYDIVAVGASWGGLHALKHLLAALPVEFGPAIVIAQHRSADASAAGLASLLESYAGRPVADAHDKDPIERGGIYLAPPDYHLLVEPGLLALSVDDRVQHARPSVDVLFESVADAYRERAVGVVLTGANRDGASGLARIKRLGGVAIVQDPEDAEAYTMPAAALRETDADAVLPLVEIPKFLIGLCMEVAQRPVRASGPVEGFWGNREVPPARSAT
jgi:two-component system, chemotaxis family, protein-glutamate methylesterase/glutaminase